MRDLVAETDAEGLRGPKARSRTARAEPGGGDPRARAAA